MTELYKHNKEAYEAIREGFKTKDRVAIVHATGTGKSYVIARTTEDFGKVLVIAPNNFVLDETRKVCREGVEFRTYASVMYEEDFNTKYDLIVLDEFHRSGAEKWGMGIERLLEANPRAKVLGTSATHIRYLDGQRNMADEMFDGNIVSSLSLKTAIDEGILPNPTYVASVYSLDEDVKRRVQAIRKSRKTDTEKEESLRKLKGVASNWENAKGVPSIVRKYYDKDMKRIIVFCSKVSKASKAREWLGRWFGQAGYRKLRFYNIDYTEKRLEREMADFQKPCEEGQLKIAISVNMLNEGVHIPRVDGVIMLRSTVSRIIIEQQIGRCLTANNLGRTPIVLDLVNNMDLIKYDAIPQWEDGVKENQRAKESKAREFPFRVIDECRDIRVFLEQMDREFSYDWTYEEVQALTQKYSVLSDFKKEHPNAYAAICRNNWHVLTSHMERKVHFYTKEECREHALLYTTRSEFQKNDRGYYDKAYDQGWLDEICSHMMKRLANVKRVCLEDARKYTLRSEWKKASPDIYKRARANNVMRECCAHMLPEPTKYSLEECKRSALRYDNRRAWSDGNSRMYNYAKTHGWLDECCAHMVWKKGRTYTLEECKKDAKRFKSRREWFEGSNRTYSQAAKNGWLDECCAHMGDKKVRTYTKEECMASASGYKYKIDWQKDCPSYVSAARRHGWYDECCVHMTSKKTGRPKALKK